MKHAFGQAPEAAPARPAREAIAPNGAAPSVKEIPYDYVATFKLLGNRLGNRVQDMINISTDGAFVAVSIGYSFIASELTQIPKLPGYEGDPVDLFNLFANSVGVVLDRNSTYTLEPTGAENALKSLSGYLFRRLLTRLCGIEFKYSIIDSGTGRELQNRAIFNLAGLGKADGDRPFRPLAKPHLFMPRSTIRIEIEEISVGPLYEGAELFIVFQGYKLLNYGAGLP